MKELDEIETRSKMQKLQAVNSYHSEYKAVHRDRHAALLTEILHAYDTGEPDMMIIRLVARLAALRDMEVALQSKVNEIKKHEHRLEEIENERQQTSEREDFHNYHGG